MKRKITILLFLLGIMISIQAQNNTREYVYDATGNRISRAIPTVLLSQSQADTNNIVLATENVLGYDIVLNPNSTKGEIDVEISGKEIESGSSYFVYNDQGLLIRKGDISSSTFSIDVSDQPDGIYVATILIDSQNLTLNIIKQNI